MKMKHEINTDAAAAGAAASAAAPVFTIVFIVCFANTGIAIIVRALVVVATGAQRSYDCRNCC